MGCAAFTAPFLRVLAGRDLPKLPMLIFPFFVRLSPLPIMVFFIVIVNKGKSS
jgi:hypothetical protein